jgi:hypothetical protein
MQTSMDLYDKRALMTNCCVHVNAKNMLSSLPNIGFTRRNMFHELIYLLTITYTINYKIKLGNGR